MDPYRSVSRLEIPEEETKLPGFANRLPGLKGRLRFLTKVNAVLVMAGQLRTVASEWHQAEQVRIHDKYFRKSTGNGIALVQFKEPLFFWPQIHCF